MRNYIVYYVLQMRLVCRLNAVITVEYIER